MGKKIIVLPDAHAHPDFDNERATWLGKFVSSEAPDYLVCLGDLADMPSLSSFDKGTKGFEGRRYKRDIDSTIDFQHKLFNNFNGSSSGTIAIFLEGNHEYRISKASNSQPELSDLLSSQRDLRIKDFWDKCFGFKEIVNVEGFAVSHFLPSGVMGHPIGGKNQAATLLTQGFDSCIVGHSHIRDFAERTSFLGRRTQSIVAGCFVHPGMITNPEGWNKNTAQMWWNGVVVLDDVAKGTANRIEYVSLETLQQRYKPKRKR